MGADALAKIRADTRRTAPTTPNPINRKMIFPAHQAVSSTSGPVSSGTGLTRVTVPAIETLSLSPSTSSTKSNDIRFSIKLSRLSSESSKKTVITLD